MLLGFGEGGAGGVVGLMIGVDARGGGAWMYCTERGEEFRSRITVSETMRRRGLRF
jgi:hypothetical protein